MVPSLVPHVTWPVDCSLILGVGMGLQRGKTDSGCGRVRCAHAWGRAEYYPMPAHWIVSINFSVGGAVLLNYEDESSGRAGRRGKVVELFVVCQSLR